MVDSVGASFQNSDMGSLSDPLPLQDLQSVCSDWAAGQQTAF